MINITFTPATGSTESPEGRPSFSLTEFKNRFQPWTPDWTKPVRVSDLIISADSLPLASMAFAKVSPQSLGFTNNKPTILLFEAPDSYALVRTDFFTRLLFTQQELLDQGLSLGRDSVTILSALRDSPASDPFWSKVGLPGIPLAIGVNASLRTPKHSELLAFKRPGSQGQMGLTVGPPVSAGANFSVDDLPPNATLALVVDTAMASAAQRELANVPVANFTRRASWRDSGRGYKPEVNFSALIPVDDLGAYMTSIRTAHAGCVLVEGHVSDSGNLSEAAWPALENWSLNFQAWCVWS